MKKILFGFLALVVLAIGAVFVAPSFIDWNAYKDDFRKVVRDATGRDLHIDGDISIAVLPAPALVAKDVRLSSIEGASAPDMATLKSAEIRIKLGPLLGGHVVVESVRLVEPVVVLEVLADGRSNMDFSAPADGTQGVGDLTRSAPDASPQSSEAADSSLTVSLENFVIDGGTVIYRNVASQQVERLDGLDATIAAASLDGPFESSGEAVFRGIPISFEVALGEIVQQRTAPLTAAVAAPAANARASIRGTLTNLTQSPRMKGTLSVSGDNLAATLQALAGTGAMPGGLAQAFDVEGEVVADAARAEFSALSFRLGDMQGTAVGSVQPGDNLGLSAAISVARFDLDKWLGMPAYEPRATADPAASIGTTDPSGKMASADLRAPLASRPAGDGSPAAFTIPTGIVGVVDLDVGAINYRGGLVRQLRASAEINKGEITVSQVAAQLPGSSDIAMFGFVTAPAGRLQFDGEVEAAVSDLRSIADWLAVEMPPVPTDRLRKVTAKAKVNAAADEVRITALDLHVDSSRLTGGLTVALRDRPAFGANLTLDRINLDSYVLEAEPRRPAEGGAATEGSSPAAGAPAAAMAPLGMLQALTSFDANVKARVASLTWRRTPMTDVAVDATLLNGSLDIRSAGIADVAGASLRLAGGIGPLGGLPALKDLRVELKAPETGRLFRLLDIEPPVAPEQLGAVAFNGRLDGNLLAPSVDARLQAAGADVTVKGAVSAVSADAMVDADISLRHPDVPRLLRALAIEYRPAGNLGAIDVAGHLKGGPAALSLTAMAARIGQDQIKGDIRVALGGERPRVEADLSADEVVIDRFLPARRAAMLRPGSPAYGRPGIVPAAWPLATPMASPAPVQPVAVAERWSREPLDLSSLGLLDGRLTLKAGALVYDRYRLESADVLANLAGGVLQAERLTGRLFGGAFDGRLDLDATAVPRLSSTLSLQGADLGALLAAFDTRAASGGRLDTAFDVSGGGRSMAEIVSALAGKGTFAATGVDVESGARGSPLAGLLGLIGGVNQLGGTLAGGRTDGRADLTGSYVLERGIARSSDIRLVSGLGNGQAAGHVDLPSWLIDVSGQIDLKQNLLAAYLTRNTERVPTTLPFTVRGPLDAPNVRLETAALQGVGIPIPGVDRLLEKNPAAGQLLQQVIPGLTGQRPAPQPQPAPQVQQQPAAPAKPTTEDVLRGLLKGLNR